MAIRYFFNFDANPGDVHTVSTEREANETQGSADTVTVTVNASDSILTHSWTTLSSVPNIADWPSGTYEVSIDVSAAGGNLTYGPNSNGSATGHIAVVDSGLTADQETKTLGSGQTGTGIKTFSDTFDPAAGDASDRLEVLIACTSSGHPSQDLTIRVGDSDSFVNTPFIAIAPPVPEANQGIYFFD